MAKHAYASDDGTRVYGGSVLLNHVQALSQEISGVHAGHEDIEFIHRARVASRRLRSAFSLFPGCLPSKKAAAWQKAIRGVTRALGEARDTDVQIERVERILKKIPAENCQPGIRRLILRLQQRRQQLQPGVVSAMGALIESNGLEQMQEHFSYLSSQAEEVYIYTPTLYQHSRQSITGRLDDFLSYDAIVTQPEKITELHEMRIRAKWLRYAIENFSALYASELKSPLQMVRKAQEMLGDIHDCDVWADFMPRFLGEERQRVIDYYGHARYYPRLVPGIEFFRQNRRQVRDELYNDFVSTWEKWRTERVWDTLRKSIQVPFSPSDAIYPPSPLEPLF
jgi:CHAD domain-containing protein